MTHQRFSRRRFLASLAAGAGATALATHRGAAAAVPAAQTPEAAAGAAAQIAPVPGQQVVVWQTVDYLPQTTALLEERLTQVAQENGFPLTFEEIPNNPQGYNRFNAAVQAGTPPDLYRLFDYQTQFWRAQGETADVTDLVQPIVQQRGGVWPMVGQTCVYQDRWWAAPYAVNAWPFHARNDLLQEAGFEFPATWDEVRAQGRELSGAPLYYYGMTLGRINDTNNHVLGMVWTFGGQLQNEDGTLAVTPDDQAWLDTLGLIRTMYVDDQIISPGSVNWDDGGNNQSFQSGQLVMTSNPTSVYNWLLQNNPDIAEKTGLYSYPAGPAGSFGQVDVWTQGLFKNGQGGDNARICLQAIIDPDWYQPYINAQLEGRFVPCWTEMINEAPWTTNQLYGDYRRIIETGRIMAYAAAPLGAFGELATKFVIGDMMQDLVVRRLSPEETLGNFVRAAQEIYSKPENRA